MWTIVLQMIFVSVFLVLMYMGVLILMGFIIRGLNLLMCKILRYDYRMYNYITGIVGTPMHEIAHASMALLFGYKVTKIQLWNKDINDNTRGYCEFAYRKGKKTLYNRIGSFFIGIAPILVGSMVVMLLMRLLIPATFNSINNIIQYVSSGQTGGGLILNAIFSVVALLSRFFSGAVQWQWWLCIVLCSLIVSHMDLSGPDIRHGATGIIFVVIIVAIVPIICAIISMDLMYKVVGYLTTGAVYLAFILTFSVILSILLDLLAAIIAPLVRLIKGNVGGGSRFADESGKTGRNDTVKTATRGSDSAADEDEEDFPAWQ